MQLSPHRSSVFEHRPAFVLVLNHLTWHEKWTPSFWCNNSFYSGCHFTPLRLATELFRIDEVLSFSGLFLLLSNKRFLAETCGALTGFLFNDSLPLARLRIANAVYINITITWHWWNSVHMNVAIFGVFVYLEYFLHSLIFFSIFLVAYDVFLTKLIK